MRLETSSSFTSHHITSSRHITNFTSHHTGVPPAHGIWQFTPAYPLAHVQPPALPHVPWLEHTPAAPHSCVCWSARAASVHHVAVPGHAILHTVPTYPSAASHVQLPLAPLPLAHVPWPLHAAS